MMKVLLKIIVITFVIIVLGSIVIQIFPELETQLHQITGWE